MANSDFPFPDLDWPPLAEFWAGAARRELKLPRCSNCQSWRWYPVDRCSACGLEAALSWVALSGRGQLYSWAIVHRAFLPEMVDTVPYVSALVVLDEDPSLRLATRIVDCDLGALRADLEVKVLFREIRFTGVEGSLMAPLFAPDSQARPAV